MLYTRVYSILHGGVQSVYTQVELKFDSPVLQNKSAKVGAGWTYPCSKLKCNLSSNRGLKTNKQIKRKKELNTIMDIPRMRKE